MNTFKYSINTKLFKQNPTTDPWNIVRRDFTDNPVYKTGCAIELLVANEKDH